MPIIETKFILIAFIISLGVLLYSINGVKKNSKDDALLGIIGHGSNYLIFAIPTFGLGMWLFSRFLDWLGVGLIFIIALILFFIIKSEKNTKN